RDLLADLRARGASIAAQVVQLEVGQLDALGVLEPRAREEDLAARECELADLEPLRLHARTRIVLAAVGSARDLSRDVLEVRAAVVAKLEVDDRIAHAHARDPEWLLAERTRVDRELDRLERDRVARRIALRIRDAHAANRALSLREVDVDRVDAHLR